jgi:transposase
VERPGTGLAATLELPAVSRAVIDDCLALIEAFAPTIDRLDAEVHQRAVVEPRVKVLTALPGVGEFTALVMLAEIGDIRRFHNARKLASWSGLTPTVRGSDLTVRHGHISKQGSAWLRWILIEAAQTAKRHPDFAPAYVAMSRRRGKKIATIAVARKLLTRAFHLLAEFEADYRRRPGTPRAATPATSRTPTPTKTSSNAKSKTTSSAEPRTSTATTSTSTRASTAPRRHPQTGTVTNSGRARKTA